MDSSKYAVTLDIETLKLAADLPGGWPALKRGEGGISCVVMWSAASGRPHLYDANTLPDIAFPIGEADVLCTFNGVQFDIPVIEGVLSRKLTIKYHIDLLQQIWGALRAGQPRKGNTLGEVAQRTLGVGKIGSGTLAPALAAEGRWSELFDYCLDDVHLTRRLFLFAQEHGGVVGSNGDLLPLNLPDWFKEVRI